MKVRCTKRKFPTRELAMLAMLEMKQTPGEGIYKCRQCGGGRLTWHISSRVQARRVHKRNFRKG